MAQVNGHFTVLVFLSHQENLTHLITPHSLKVHLHLGSRKPHTDFFLPNGCPSSVSFPQSLIVCFSFFCVSSLTLFMVSFHLLALNAIFILKTLKFISAGQSSPLNFRILPPMANEIPPLECLKSF